MGAQHLQTVLSQKTAIIGPSSPAVTAANKIAPLIRAWGGEHINFLGFSGSYAKGTAVKGGTDVDLFISLRPTLNMTLAEIYNRLHQYMRDNGYPFARAQNVSIGIYGTSAAKSMPYIHSGFLCFDSGWNTVFGQPFESAMAEGQDQSLVNLICVAQFGVFEIDGNTQVSKLTDKAVTYFFFRLLSILQQKATVPMIDVMAYAEWLDRPVLREKTAS
jgi:hypothetical protein